MGLRLQSEFHSLTDKLFKIEIYQQNYGSGITSFTVASDGFTLEYVGETDDIVSPIIGSRCIINAYNQVGAFDSFINKVTNRQEHLFYVKVSRDTGSGYQTYWTGVVTQDLISELDESKPRIFQIVAVDGIGLLANKDYEATGYQTIEGFLEEAVGAIGLDEVYSSTDDFYATVVNVWDTAQDYALTSDVTTLTRFDARVYNSKEEDGTIIYSNYLEVLKELCITFGARFYQRNGVFYFEQYLERAEVSRNVHTYQFNGVSSGNSSESDDITLNGTSTGGARLAGNTFNFLPALQKVQVSFNKSRANNLLGSGMTFVTSTPRQDLGFVNSADNGRLQIIGDLIYQLVPNGTPGTITNEHWRPVWDVEIRVQDINNLGTFYYLKRDWQPGLSGAQLYGPTSWTTNSSDRYHIDGDIGVNEATGIFLSTAVSIVTPPLPVSGDAQLDVNFDDVYDNTNASQTVPAYFNEIVESKNFRVLYSNDSGSVSDATVYSATNNVATIKSNLILDLGVLRVSDATGLQGSFYVYNGSTWEKSSQWRRGDSGTYQSLLSLLTKEILSLHYQPIKIYSGVIAGPFEFGRRYVFDSTYWLMMGGSYNANLDEWSGEWFVIDKDDAGIATDTPVGSGGGADFQARVSSQQGTDEIIIATEVNTTDATVEGAFETNGSVGTAINEITATAGGDITIANTDHMNVITWSGGNGRQTINLPTPVNGVMLRFKTDSTISNSKDILLSAGESITIDGGDSYVMDRSYDGISLMAFNGGWLIIQKKEK